MIRITIFLAATLWGHAALSEQPVSEQAPNIVLIIADDLGWGDVGYNGSEIETPNLDRLAKQGLRLDRFYSQPYCTATRASLMTGQAAARIGIRGPFLAAGDAQLPLRLKILPEFLREAGYQTALVGKWHLGHARKEALPLARGFEHAYGYLTGGLGYWDRVSSGGYDWHRNETTLREKGYATHLIADEAVRLIEQGGRDKPLFLYAAFSAPHLPNEAPEQTIAKYSGIENEHRRVFAAMVDELDAAIGRIIAALQDNGMTDNTLVWFFSDNGGTNEKYSRGGFSRMARFIEDKLGSPAPLKLLELIRSTALDGGGDNGPYKGGKGSVYEGGVLVPSVVSWPGTFPSRAITQRITVHDMMPTLLAIAGVKPKHGQAIDGADQSGLLRGDTATGLVDFLVESKGDSAYYMDDWKLHRDEAEALTLFDLEQDPFEQTDLACDYPDIVSIMAQRLREFPRGDGVNASKIWLYLHPETWGGEETSEPWADRFK